MIAGELASNSVRGQIALPKYIQSIYHYIPSGTLSRFASLILISPNSLHQSFNLCLKG